MSLISLYEMGANSKRLVDFFNFYSTKLEESIPCRKSINNSNWKEFLGLQTYYNDYRNFFKKEKKRLVDIKKVISIYFPLLAEGYKILS